ncbi:MAG: MFS transporter [Planctomycetia bacterium]|nr:MFS transporter [Planctomycetia bacterium]
MDISRQNAGHKGPALHFAKNIRLAKKVSAHMLNKQQEKSAVEKSLDLSIKDGVAFAATTGFGDNYINPFAVALGASNFQIGLLSSIPQLLPALMQLKVADMTERLGSRKKIIVRSVFLHAFMLLPIALVPYVSKSIQIGMLIGLCTLYMLFASLAGPAWGSLMADLVPLRKRGVFFSKRSRLIGLVTLSTTFLAGYTLHLFKTQSLIGFTIIFFLAMISRYISCYFLSRMYEPPLEVKREHYFSFGAFVRRLNVGNFGKYVIFQSTFNFAVFIASPFFTVFMLRDLGFSYLTYTIVVITVPLATILSMSYWGRYSDALGNRRVMRICSIIISVLPALWLVSHEVYFLIGIQVLAGFFWGGFNLCSSNFIYESAIPEKRTRCISYFNTINGLAICLGNLLGGFLATHIPPVLGYRLLTLFAISSCLRIILSTTLLSRVKEIRNTVSASV